MVVAHSYSAILQVVLVLCYYFYPISSQEAPVFKNVKICSARDPFLNQCIQESAEKMLRNLSPGSSVLGIDPLDPIYVPEYALPPGNLVIPTWAFKSTNNVQRGWGNATVQHASVDSLGRTFNLRFVVPRLHLRSRMETSGSLAGIPLEGEGDFEMTFFNLTYDMKFNGDLVEKDGRHHLNIHNFYQESKMDGILWNFKNLSNDPIITQRANNMLNSRQDEISAALGPAPNTLSSQAHQKILQRILDKVPYDAMFIDLPFI